MITGLPVAS